MKITPSIARRAELVLAKWGAGALKEFAAEYGIPVSTLYSYRSKQKKGKK